jgi:hypothetical protein
VEPTTGFVKHPFMSCTASEFYDLDNPKMAIFFNYFSVSSDISQYMALQVGGHVTKTQMSAVFSVTTLCIQLFTLLLVTLLSAQ